MKQHEMIMGVSYTIALLAVVAFAICIVAAVCLTIRDGIKKILKIQSPSGSEEKKLNLFQKYKKYKPYRKQHIIEPKVTFEIDNYNYLFSLFPTVMFQPFFARYPNCYVIDIMWLNFNIGIGLWKNNPNYKEEDIY